MTEDERERERERLARLANKAQDDEFERMYPDRHYDFEFSWEHLTESARNLYRAIGDALAADVRRRERAKVAALVAAAFATLEGVRILPDETVVVRDHEALGDGVTALCAALADLEAGEERP